jgi:anaerobic magnesium-protoporphyrin IX monomethyl ester cyclase
MKVLLTHGYFLGEDAKEQKLMRPYPPLGILYIAAYLEKHGIPVEVFDTTFSTRAALYQHLLRSQPDVVGLYTNLMTKLGVLEIIRDIRANRTSSAGGGAAQRPRIVLGGPEVTHHVDAFLGAGADVVVIGEGEETMRELVDAFATGRPLAEIAGLGFRGADGKTVRTAARPLIRSLDDLPLPKREALDLTPYLEAWRERHGTNAISVSTMRGCPYTCRWCSRAVYGGSYRRRSPHLVADEIQGIVDRYHPDSLWFVDDVFTINHGWLEKFTDELERRNLRVRYECITRADRLNERVVSLLRRSGCFRVWIGAESGSQKILDAMDRRVTVEQVRDMIQLSKKHGIETGTFIMLGYPGETEADIEATIEHLKRADPDQFTITVSYPIKGTPFYDDVRGEIIDPGPWATSTDRDIRLRGRRSSFYYRFAVSRVVNEVRHFQVARRSGGSLSLTAAKHQARALVARAGMRLDSALHAIETRTRRVRRPA